MVIAAGKFKATCLELMDRVQRTREEVVITKRGKAVARLVPVDADAPRPTFGLLSDQTQVYGDIVAPTGEAWDADE